MKNANAMERRARRRAERIVNVSLGERWTFRANKRAEGNRNEPESGACFLFAAESRPQNVWVGLLARKERARLCRARVCFTFPGRRRVGFEAARLSYSGGTAPALHRTSLLCPRGHPNREKW